MTERRIFLSADECAAIRAGRKQVLERWTETVEREAWRAAIIDAVKRSMADAVECTDRVAELERKLEEARLAHCAAIRTHG